MPKKATVSVSANKVTVKEDASIKKYNRDADGLDEVLKGLGNKKGWNAEVKLDKKGIEIERVTGLGYPDISGHPGHVHGKGWKYNIERGNGSVDRLVVEDWSASVKSQEYDAKRGKITATIDIEVTARALEDTH